MPSRTLAAEGIASHAALLPSAPASAAGLRTKDEGTDAAYEAKRLAASATLRTTGFYLGEVRNCLCSIRAEVGNCLCSMHAAADRSFVEDPWA